VNDQEKAWSGEFGDSYTARNDSVPWWDRVEFWDRVFSLTRARSVLEVGCNSGANLMAMRTAAPGSILCGVDVNASALEYAKFRGFSVENLSALKVGVRWDRRFELVATVGMLIHVAPEHLLPTMTSILAASYRWILCVEYDAAEETPLLYRGQIDRLWKRSYGELYERLGLKLHAAWPAGGGFDACHAWLLERPGVQPAGPDRAGAGG
jgi:pseudaminic acid biosynthesis-associated methylase